MLQKKKPWKCRYSLCRKVGDELTKERRFFDFFQVDLFRKCHYEVPSNFLVGKTYIWPSRDIRSFQKFRSRCQEIGNLYNA